MEVTTALRMDLSRQQEDECTKLAQQFFFALKFCQHVKNFEVMTIARFLLKSFEIFYQRSRLGFLGCGLPNLK
jgi:hypothetical protein